MRAKDKKASFELHKLQEQISAGHSDAYTAPLVEIARKAIAEQHSSPEQQSQLLSLVELAEQLPAPSEKSFLGSTAKRF